MSLPEPQPGLVIRYSYLWKREAAAGREEGVKDRPCAVVLAIANASGVRRVYVLPITHALPDRSDAGIEIPESVKQRLGLDGERSWVIVSEANVFAWPRPDLRMIPEKGSASVAYGYLPPGLFKVIRDRFLALDAERKSAVVTRSE